MMVSILFSWMLRGPTVLLSLLLVLLPAGLLSAQQSPEATIQLTVVFDPRILEAVDVKLICTMEQRLSRTIPMKAEETRDLALTSLEKEGNACQLLALLPAGHEARYTAGGDSTHRADRNGCHFADIDPGERSNCQIEVIQEPVRLTVFKKWVGPSGEEPDVRISLECEGGDYSGDRFINEGKPDGWEIVNIGPEGVLCNVSEEVRETYRPDIIDCQGLWLLPGKGEACTMLNTKIVKRIEMLNRYGIVVMAILVLGVGLIAVRRLR